MTCPNCGKEMSHLIPPKDHIWVCLNCHYTPDAEKLWDAWGAMSGLRIDIPLQPVYGESIVDDLRSLLWRTDRIEHPDGEE